MAHSSDLTDGCWVESHEAAVGECALSLFSRLLSGMESLVSTRYGATLWLAVAPIMTACLSGCPSLVAILISTSDIGWVLLILTPWYPIMQHNVVMEWQVSEWGPRDTRTSTQWPFTF